MKKINVLQLILVLCLSITFFSCDKEYDNAIDGYVVNYDSYIYGSDISLRLRSNAFFESYISFEDANEQNVLTSSDAPIDSILSICQDTIDWLEIKCIRNSDNADLTSTLSCALINTENGAYNIYANLVPVGGHSPVLWLSWIDMDMRSGTYRQGTYDETYTLTIKNTKMKTKPVHTIKWTVHVQSGVSEGDIYWAKACEVDGEKYDLECENAWCYWYQNSEDEYNKLSYRRKVTDFFHFKDE